MKKTITEVYARHFGVSATAFINRAIQELWDRRDEPSTEQAQNLARYGVEGVVEDFDQHDLSNPFLNDEFVVVIADDLTPILMNRKNCEAMVRRFRARKPTQIVIRGTLTKTAEGDMTAIATSNMVALTNFARMLSAVEREQYRQELLASLVHNGEEAQPLRFAFRVNLKFNRTWDFGGVFSEREAIVYDVAFGARPRTAMHYRNPSDPYPHTEEFLAWWRGENQQWAMEWPSLTMHSQQFRRARLFAIGSEKFSFLEAWNALSETVTRKT